MASLGRHLHHFSFNTVGNWSPRDEDVDPPEVSDDDAMEALAYDGMEDDDLLGVTAKGITKWHVAAVWGRLDLLRWLKQKNGATLMDAPNHAGSTPLHQAILDQRPQAAEFFLDEGADVAAVDHSGYSVLMLACASNMSPAFIQRILARLPPAQVDLRSVTGVSSVRAAVSGHTTPVPVVQQLVLHGATSHPDDFPASVQGDDMRPVRRKLLLWAQDELRVREGFYAMLRGVHDAGGGEKEGAGVIAASPRNPLPALRGDRNTDARMRIGSSLGLRVGVELRGVRSLLGALVALEGQAAANGIGGEARRQETHASGD